MSVAGLTALDGSTFFVSDASGDLDAERADGFFHEDMRHLSPLASARQRGAAADALER